MIKYADTKVVFQEVPDKVSLAINITNCQQNCKGCHSPYLKGNIGTLMTTKSLDELIKQNEGINCVIFMGEGNDREALIAASNHIHHTYPNIETALYSGRVEVEDDIYEAFDYVKVGPYNEKLGPLNKRTTNQRMYRIYRDGSKEDITNRFWA